MGKLIDLKYPVDYYALNDFDSNSLARPAIHATQHINGRYMIMRFRRGQRAIELVAGYGEVELRGLF